MVTMQVTDLNQPEYQKKGLNEQDLQAQQIDRPLPNEDAYLKVSELETTLEILADAQMRLLGLSNDQRTTNYL